MMIAVILREIKKLLTTAKLLLILLLGAASAYALLIGNLYNGHTIDHVQIAICDLDNSAMSRELIQNIHDISTYDIVATTNDEAIAQNYLATNEALGVLIIPEDFSQKISRQQSVNLAFITDGTNTLYLGYGLNSMQEVVGTFSAKYQALANIKAGTPTLPAVPVQLSMRIEDNPTNSYSLFYIYGVMVTAAQLGIMLSFSMSIYDDYRSKIKLHTTLLRALIAKEIVYILLSSLSLMIALSIILGIFNLPFKGSPLHFFMIYFAFAFAVTNLAGLLALYFKTKIALLQCLIFYALPAFLLSGYIWPQLGMIPLWQFISYLFPIQYIMTDFRNIALIGNSSTLYLHTGILILIGLPCFTILYTYLKHHLPAKISLYES